MRNVMIFALSVVFVSSALAYDMGQVPQFKQGMLLTATVPPEGSVPETEQWPECIWWDVNGTQLVMYAKHLEGYNSETTGGKFAVWVGPPLAYIREVEKQHAYGPADAAAYLSDGEITAVSAQMYVGPGDKWGEAPGYAAWTPTADRCKVCVLEAKNSGTRHHGIRVSLWAETQRKPNDKGKVYLYRGMLDCICPTYPDPGPTAPWIRVVSGGQTIHVVDQWGLPGNSPVPADEGEGAPGTLAADAQQFVGAWVDGEAGTLTTVSADGTWRMMSTAAEDAGIRAGNWGVADGRLTLRTCLASASQTWLKEAPAESAQRLVTGPFDMTMVWDLQKQGNALSGTLRTWAAKFAPSGTVMGFTAWDAVGNRPAVVTWMPALEVYRPITAPDGTRQVSPEFQGMLERMRPGGAGSKDWALDFIREGDTFGDERDTQ